MRKLYGQRRVGHAGTLDPDATGVLLVGLGRATRLLRYLQDAGKSYRARVVFGVATDTLDASGAVLERAEMPLEQRAGRARGARRSSATSSRSRRWCRRSRSTAASSTSWRGRGRRSSAPPRHVRIDALVVEEFVGGAYPEATIRVDCSSGTYVRTLAADLGTALGGCAHLGELRRLRVGSFGARRGAHDRRDRGRPRRACVLTPAAALRDLTEVVVEGEQQRAVAHGATFAAPALLGDDRRARPVRGRRRARRAARRVRAAGRAA